MGDMYNFQKVGVWVKVRTWRCINMWKQKFDIARYFDEKYTFFTFINVT